MAEQITAPDGAIRGAAMLACRKWAYATADLLKVTTPPSGVMIALAASSFPWLGDQNPCKVTLPEHPIPVLLLLAKDLGCHAISGATIRNSRRGGFKSGSRTRPFFDNLN